MAAFNTSTFAYNQYAQSRPDYPSSLYDLIFSYHKGGRESLVDLGCGHGTVTRALASHFNRAAGVDPSSGMLEEAQRITADSGISNVSFVQGNAESIPDIPDHSVDLVVAGQAAHWFPYPPDKPNVWDEMRRIVKAGGTVAFWGYADTLFPLDPMASALLHKWAYEKGEIEPGKEGMGSHWSFPGRARIETLYGGLPLDDTGGSWIDARWVRKDDRQSLEWFNDVEAVCGIISNPDLEKDVSDNERLKLKMERRMTVTNVKSLVATPVKQRDPLTTVNTVKALSDQASETALSVITPPEVTRQVLQEAKEVGIRAVFLQPGSYDQDLWAWTKSQWPDAAVADFDKDEQTGFGTVGGEGWCVLADGERAMSLAGRESKL
ncbi:MAG: hypothetical protein Q9162_001733 [Coniocarpon cinnabarinum]